MRYRVVSAVFAALAFFLVGCPADEDDCACTMEYRYNVCVTVNGSADLPDSVSFVRERQDGARDSLESFLPSNCFGELPGTQRILMLRNSAPVDSSDWFTLATVDCCHGEAKTINFEK